MGESLEPELGALLFSAPCMQPGHPDESLMLMALGCQAAGSQEWERPLVHGQLSPEECVPQSMAASEDAPVPDLHGHPAISVCQQPIQCDLSVSSRGHLHYNLRISYRLVQKSRRGFFVPASKLCTIHLSKCNPGSPFQNTSMITEHACQGMSFTSGRQGKRQGEKGPHDLSVSMLPDTETRVLLLPQNVWYSDARKARTSSQTLSNTQELTETSFLTGSKHTLKDLGCLYPTWRPLLMEHVGNWV